MFLKIDAVYIVYASGARLSVYRFHWMVMQYQLVVLLYLTILHLVKLAYTMPAMLAAW